MGSAKSTSNYGTIYKRPDTKFWRIEIKLKHSDRIKYVLDKYRDKKRKQFNERCLEVLVKCINFVTPGSKNKSTARKQPSWSKFIGSGIKKINWSKLHKERSLRREKSEQDLLDKRIRRLSRTKDNLIKKYRDTHTAEEINKLIADTDSTTIDWSNLGRQTLS